MQRQEEGERLEDTTEDTTIGFYFYGIVLYHVVIRYLIYKGCGSSFEDRFVL